MDAASFNPFLLIINLLADAKEFDQNHEDDADYMDKAEESMGFLVCWLWNVRKGLVKTKFALRLDDSEMQTYQVRHNTLHNLMKLLKALLISFQVYPTQSLVRQMLPSRMTEALDTTKN